MPFTGTFSISQGIDASGFILSDTSLTTDVTVTERRVYLKKADGVYIVPVGSVTAYIPWVVATNPLVVTGLFDKDYALEVTVEWVSPTPEEGGVYTATDVVVFKAYLEQFDYGLTQVMQANPAIVNDTPFFSNKAKLRVFMDSAVNAVTQYDDILNGQYNLDKGTYMSRNANIYF